MVLEAIKKTGSYISESMIENYTSAAQEILTGVPLGSDLFYIFTFFTPIIFFHLH